MKFELEKMLDEQRKRDAAEDSELAARVDNALQELEPWSEKRGTESHVALRKRSKNLRGMLFHIVNPPEGKSSPQ